MNATFFAFFAPFVAAAFAPYLTRLMGHKSSYVLALVPAALFIHFFQFLPEVANGERVTGGVQWIPSLGITFSWLIDGLSLTFALLISGIGTLIILYAGAYLKSYAQQGRFLMFMLLFMGAMQGLVLADSFLMLFVFWELTSIASFLLIGFDHKRTAARRAALQALVVTGIGGLSLLAGLIVIWFSTGVNHMSLLLAGGDVMRDSPFYLAALLLILGGAFTKSAQFPMHFWLPNAMEAPTPVSAYLHSATMVKAGVYLLMRLNPAMGDTVLWETILPIFGGTTLLVGTLLAVRQTDLKLMLAYTTVASLGLLVMLTGFGTEAAISAAVLYLIAHSLFKGALFMIAGIIDHESGTRNLLELGGLRKAMPITFFAAILAALSMGGLLPFYGFLAKEEIYYALAGASPWAITFTIVAIIGNALMFAAAFGVGLRPFIGKKIETPKHAHDGPFGLMAAPVVLALCGLAAGLFYKLAHFYFSSPMATAVAGEDVLIKIGPIPHLNTAFALSLVTIALGVLLYMKLDDLRASMQRVLETIGWGPDKGFDQFISAIISFADSATRRINNGNLERYMTVTFILVAIVLLVPMIFGDELPAIPAFPDIAFYQWAVLIICAIGIVVVVTAQDRLTAIVSLGIQGFAVALIFLLMGAPDLAFTQFMVETLAVVILALVMTRLKLQASDARPMGEMIRDMIIASACGIGFGLMLLKSVEGVFNTDLADFFAQYSSAIARGKNIVNVILVDFRGVDTLGEIGVVMAAGLAILALIRVRVSKPKAAEKVGDQL